MLLINMKKTVSIICFVFILLIIIPNVNAGVGYSILNVIGSVFGNEPCGKDLIMSCCEQTIVSGAIVCKTNSVCNESVPVWNSEKSRPRVPGLKVYYSSCWNIYKLKRLGYYPLFKYGEFNPPENWTIKKNEITWDIFGDIKFYSKNQYFSSIEDVGIDKLKESSKTSKLNKPCWMFWRIF